MKDTLFKLPKELPRHRESVPVYRTFHFDSLSRSNKLFVESCNERMDFLKSIFETKGEQRDLGDELIIRSDKEALEMYLASDSFWWTDRVNAYSEDPGNSRGLLSTENAHKTTEEWVKRLRLNSELMKLDTVNNNFFSRSNSSDERDSEEIPTSVTVNLRFEVDNLPIFGPGAKVQASFIKDGQLVEFLHFFRKLGKEPRSVRTISPEDAIQLVTGNFRFRKLKKSKRNKGNITSITLGYYSMVPSDYQKYLIPVYRVRGEVSTPDLKNNSFELFVLAVRSTPMRAKKLAVISEPLISRVFN